MSNLRCDKMDSIFRYVYVNIVCSLAHPTMLNIFVLFYSLIMVIER